MLQVGGEHDAVTAPAPGEGVDSEQLSMQDVLAATTPGWLDDQVRGMLLSCGLPVVLGRLTVPMTSVNVATTFCGVPLVMEKDVCCEPTSPTSSVMFWMGQVSKKSRTGEFPCALEYRGC